MSTKRLFQVLDEMNVNDEVNKTATCDCCFDMVGANKVKAGGHVTMGVPTEAVLKLLLGEYMPMLVLLDKKEYHRLEDVPVEEKLQAAEAKADRYEKALRFIQAWQFPPTGQFWDDDKLKPMSYAACYGSNGEQDFMRNVATEALTPKTSSDE